MKRLACVLLAWAPPVLAQVRADDTSTVEARVLDWAPGASWFGSRDGATPVYRNILAEGPGSVYFTGGAHDAMEFLSLERLDGSGRRVASPVRLNAMDLVVVAEHPDVPFDVTVEFFERFSEWRPLSAGVAGGSLGKVSFRVDCDGPQCRTHHIDLNALGGISLPRGQCCVAVRCSYTGRDPGPSGYPVFRSGDMFPGPDVGYSADNFYSDANGDGRFTANERLSLGGFPNVANLAVTLYGDDGCALDFNGDGFVNGVDIDKVLALIAGGCP